MNLILMGWLTSIFKIVGFNIGIKVYANPFSNLIVEI